LDASGAGTAGRALRLTANGVLCGNCGATSETGLFLSRAACAALASFQNVGGIASALRIVLTPEMSRELHNGLQHLVQVHLTGMRQLKSEQIFSRIQS
jgi:hypothetical protein